MKNSIKKMTFKDYLALVPVDAKNTVIHSITGVLLRKATGGIYMIGTTLGVHGRVFYPCRVGQFDDILVPLEILKGIKEIESISVEDGFGTINGIRFQQLDTLDNFPEMPDFDQANIDATTKITVPKGLEKFVSNDEMRVASQNVCLAKNGWAATNFHELLWVKQENDIPQDLVIPVETYRYITKSEITYYSVVMGERQLDNNETESFPESIIFADSCGKVVYKSRLIDAKYPDYTVIIPQEVNDTVRCDVQAIKKYLDTAIKTIKPHHVRFDINGSLKLTASDEDFNKEYATEIPCEHTGDDRTHHFDPKRLAKAIGANVLSDEFGIYREMMVIKKPEYTYLLMGMYIAKD